MFVPSVGALGVPTSSYLYYLVWIEVSRGCLCPGGVGVPRGKISDLVLLIE